MDETRKMKLPDEEMWKIMNSFSARHGIVIMFWKMRGEDNESCPMYISDNIASYGYEAEMFLEKKICWADIIYEADRKKAQQESYQNIINASNRFVQEYRILKKDNTIVWIHADVSIIRDNYKQAQYIETIITNINESKLYERRLLQGQREMQQEMEANREVAKKMTVEDRLTELIKEQRIELLQNTFTEIYGVHAAIVGLDYHFYTNMSGPKEEGIFYDIQELGSFRRKVEELNEALAVGRKEAILLLNNPSIKIAGVPIMYKEKQIATWIMCCLANRQTQEILKVLKFMRTLTDNMSEYYGNYMGSVSLKGYALERLKLKNMISMQEKILDIYDKIQDISSEELSVQTIFQMTGKMMEIERIAIYKYMKNSIYCKCEQEWVRQDILEDPDLMAFISVKAMPSPQKILEKQEIAVINSIWIPREWQDTFEDLNAKAVVILPIKFGENSGFICFLEELEDRVWKEEEIEFFKKIQKIIEKVLLKSE